MEKYQQRYLDEKTTRLSLRFVHSTDGDILEKLDSVPSRQSYIKALIREDIARGKPVKTGPGTPPGKGR